MTEPDLDREFFDPIFRLLGHVAHIQVRTDAGDFPDYVFFEGRKMKEEAERFLAVDRVRFFRYAIALGELKAWDVPLDGGRLRKGRYELDPSHPTGQLYGYLLRNGCRWGILTNGRKWRLYHYDGGWPRVGRYYEVDLPALASSEDLGQLTYFVYFFRREAFAPDISGKTPLDRVRDGSVEYSQALAEDLKDSVYSALVRLANGFVKWTSNNLDPKSPEQAKLIHDNSLRLLYRLLFIFKAESIGLLPMNNRVYRTQRSLDALKRKIRERFREPANPILNDSDEYHAALSRLFALIDRGSALSGQPDHLGIPPYNGGLFRQTRPGSNQPDFLSVMRIGDADLAQVIDLLARHTGAKTDASDESGFVDYSSLESPQLGTLYEGLLEYKLGLAENEDYVAIGKKESWVPISQYSGKPIKDLGRIAPAGSFFLKSDKGERHSSGTYYTPDFVVRYIIEKALSPVLERRLSQARESGQSARDAVLAIRVLDPAMGSGQFLVNVVDFLTPWLLRAVDDDRASGRLREDYEISTEEARREIVAHCVYGVDLNPMAVELAKVTLWLHTLSRGKPLSFLDHHLKTGNSLLSANVRRLSRYPDKATQAKWKNEIRAAREARSEQRFADPATFPPLFLERITGKIAEIDDLRDETADAVRRKERIYQDLRRSKEFKRIEDIADAWLAAFFGVHTSRDNNDMEAQKNYSNLQWALHHTSSEEEWGRKESVAALDRIRALAQSKQFFHWEFEFPDVFFENGILKDGAGFDAVVGNPPYVNINTVYKSDPQSPPVLASLFLSCGVGRYDLYVAFVERAKALLSRGGELGYILPNKWFKGKFGRPLRGLLSSRKSVREIVDWRGYYTLFRVRRKGPITFVALLFASARLNETFRYVAFPSLKPSEDREVAAQLLARSHDLANHQSLELIVAEMAADRLTEKPWIFTTGGAKALLDRLRRLPRLDSEASVFAGTQTSAQPIYVLEDTRRNDVSHTVVGWSEALSRAVEVESDAVRPLLRGEEIARYRIFASDAVIIFPYDLNRDSDGKAVTGYTLISQTEMLQRLPKTWKYLNEPSIRSELENREPETVVDPITGRKKKVGRFVGRQDWYAYTYPRAMTRFSQAKLAFPDAASEGTVAFDRIGRVLMQSVYGVEMLGESKYSPFFIQAVLNSDVFTFFMQETSNRLKDGFFRFQTEYVQPFPIPHVEWTTPQQHRSLLLEESRKMIGEIADGGEEDELLSWVDTQMAAGRTDVVHDAVVDLVESLNQLHAKNVSDTKQFLTWLERTYFKPGVRLGELVGTGTLRSFAEHPFQDLLDVLRKNAKKLKSSPKTLEFHNELERAYGASVGLHGPRIQVALRLKPALEEIVFRLYRLTQEERLIVAESAATIQYR